jgi:hypothetical protein
MFNTSVKSGVNRVEAANPAIAAGTHVFDTQQLHVGSK